ncbi:MAG: endolytic transglycosylase MltG [Deferrisomatales bacterium]|nr:endolytic transglycosylase MltG [Deferrisomatales bacterium]
MISRPSLPHRIAWLLVTLVLAALVLLPLRLAQYVHQPRGEGRVRFQVARGDGPRQLAESLAVDDLASWPRGTALGMRLWGEPGAMKAGNYDLPAPTRLVDVYRAVALGQVHQVTVTFPEGLTAKEMAPLLEQAGVTAADGFLAVALDPQAAARWGLPGSTLEGFLFPDTYRFAEGVGPDTVVAAMVARFRGVTEPLAGELARRELGLLEWVTLASVVEKETGAEEEKPLIAGVFTNRLRRRMRLESDPTVIYGLAFFDGNLRRRDLDTDTPYNTYTRRGLPAGPIANPGRSSLVAVLRPAKVPYLYFVSRNDGTHEFSATYEDHLAAVDRYQRRRR